jgi:chaperone protein PapD
MRLNQIARRNFAKTMLVSLIGVSTISYSAITLDRTRAIYNGSQKSLSITLSNKNKHLPYLAQAWIEDSTYKKGSSPFIILPPLQRIEAGESNQVRIETSTKINQLPQDRESLYYFNIREVPPKSDKPNVMQIALQSKIKLFYRPQGLEVNPTELIDNPWQNKLLLKKQNDELIAKNPTPYYVTILTVRQSKDGPDAPNFEAKMVAPFSQEVLPVKAQWVGNTPVVTYINDYGGRPQLQFQCQVNDCYVTDTPIKE